MTTTQTVSLVSFRAGTDLTYNVRRGSNLFSRSIEDVAYIKPEGDYYLAISLSTGITAINETEERAYQDLVFKLFDALSKVVEHPNAMIGQKVSGKILEESKKGLKMPSDRQLRSLTNGINDFCLASPEKVHRSLKKIETNCGITTSELEDTVMDVDVCDIIDVDID